MKKHAPLDHEHLELKNNLLELARGWWQTGDLEKRLASLIIYASFAEYLAEHLLNSLRYAVERASYSAYSAIVYLKPKEVTNRPPTMYDYINRLEGFEFPDKSNIIQLLKDISKPRNKLFHNFARIKPDEAIDKFLEDIQAGTEELINRVNTVEAALKAMTNQELTQPTSQDKKNEA